MAGEEEMEQWRRLAVLTAAPSKRWDWVAETEMEQIVVRYVYRG